MANMINESDSFMTETPNYYEIAEPISLHIKYQINTNKKWSAQLILQAILSFSRQVKVMKLQTKFFAERNGSNVTVHRVW